jgi:tripartite ATP-independent transporter DctM subunit
MTPTLFTLVAIACLLGMLFLGIPIVVALGTVSVLGVAWLTGGFDAALNILSNTAFEGVRDYVFAVIPLFMLMGEFVSRSGAAEDLYLAINRMLRRLPGRLAIATVGGNAVFAAVVGVSVASAAAFSRIAYPAMMKAGYQRSTALGCIAGSSALGMLIPPSVLMIVWGVVTQESIGALFVAGVVPGLLLALMYAAFCLGYALLRPERFGAAAGAAGRAAEREALADTPLSAEQWVGCLGCLLLIVLVLGGIWFGVFTPTEGAGVGALLALAVALVKGMRMKGVLESIAEAGRTAAPILLLLIFAQMYSRMLALGGLGGAIQGVVRDSGLTPGMILMVMAAVWFLLGMFIDSVSTILLTVPIFAPVAVSLGIDPIAFALVGILVIEAGIITPPFGLAVFTVKASINDAAVSLGQIFKGATPYWVMLLVLAAAVYHWPGLATWLPSVM